MAAPPADPDEERRRFSAIVESSEDGIISKNLEGTVTSWNAGAERLFGYTADEIVGRSISVLMPPERRSEMAIILGRISRGERVEHFETVRIAKDGRLIPVSLSVSPVKDAAGRIIGAAKIARDISERLRADAERERLFLEAREALQVRDTFLSIAGHEFRTPLNALAMQLYNLETRSIGPSERAAVAKAQKEVDRLAALTHQLLDVARMNAGSFSLEKTEIDLAGLAAEVVGRMQETAAHDGVRLQLRTEAPVGGNWDRARLDQVLSNLLVNAIKFGRNSTVEVTVERRGLLARLSVRDHGIGVAPRDRDRIFDRFARAVPERSFGGLGLGLWIARQIVEAHGGRIVVEGPEGGGAEFIVELPAKR